MFGSQPSTTQTNVQDAVAKIQALIAAMLRDLHNNGSAALDGVRNGLGAIEKHATDIHLMASGQAPVASDDAPQQEVEAPKGLFASMFGGPPVTVGPDGTPLAAPAPSQPLLPQP